MHVNLNKPLKSSFLSCEKDAQIIIRKLFADHPQHARNLKKLLVINTKDCLDEDKASIYNPIVDAMGVADLVKQEYITLVPKVRFEEYPEVKSRVIISFDNFTSNATNPEFRDCTVHFDIICYTDQWDLGDQRLRPLKIAGYIDGLLDKAKLTGIGEFNFMTCAEEIYSPDLSGYSLMYRAVHGEDDKLEPVE